MAKRQHGIGTGRTSGRKVRGNGGRHEHDGRGYHKRWRIERFNGIELTLDEPGQVSARGQTRCNADSCQCDRRAHCRQDQIAGLRTQRHANAKLSAPLRHRIGNHPEQPDRGE